MTTYYESAEGQPISQARAIKEYAAHGATNPRAELIADMGDSGVDLFKCHLCGTEQAINEADYYDV